MISDFVKETFKKTFKYFDKNFTILIAIEEMSELQKELLKNINRSKNNQDKILEELCDVYIFLELIKKVYNFDDLRVSKHIDQKVTEKMKLPEE